MSFYEDLVMQTQMNYSGYYSVYASGGTPYELSDKKQLPYKEQIEELVRQVKEAVSIPVIGNGDVISPQKAEELVRQTGCDGIMIARGAEGNPWIFSEMIAYEETGIVPPRPDKDAVREMMLRHARLQLQYKGEYCGIREMRKHVAWYTKGLKGAARLREKVNEVESLEELENLLTSL